MPHTHDTVNLEIIYCFLLIQIMQFSEYHNNKNTHF